MKRSSKTQLIRAICHTTFYILLLSVASCNSSDDTGKTKTLNDAKGDAAFSFIDISYIKRTTKNNLFIVEMGLLGSINSLTYDATNSMVGVEYNYLIRFDLDGSDSLLNKLTITLTSSKDSGDSQKTGALLDFATLEVGISKPDTGSNFIKVETIPVESAKIVDNNKIVITLDKNSNPDLGNLGTDTPLVAHSYFQDAGTIYFDNLPDDLKYSK